MITSRLNNDTIVDEISQQSPFEFTPTPDKIGIFTLQGVQYTKAGIKRKLQAEEKKLNPQPLLPVQGCDEQPPQKQPTQKKKYATHPRTHSKNQPLVHIRSDVVSNAIEKAISTQNAFMINEEQLTAYAVQKFELNDGQKGQVILSIPVMPDDTWDTVTQALQVLGDGVVDTFHALVAISLQKHGLAHMREPIEFSPDTILELTGKGKNNDSGYTKEQRKEILKHIKLMSHVHLTATIPTYRAKSIKGRSIPQKTITIAKGAILDLLSFELKEYDAITGEEILTMHSVALGKWTELIPGVTDKIALISTKVLEYSAKNQIYPKLIGRYLTKMFRINAHRNNCEFRYGISMRALFEGAGIEPHRKRGEFVEAIKRAIDTLKKDNVIGGFTYEPLSEEIKARIHERARGWFEDYLNVKINFTPPKEVLEHYKTFAKPEA